MITLFATTPKGIEPLLAEELKELGAASVKASQGGVSFQGNLSIAYRACLWSRTASRILLSLAHFPAPTADTLYQGVRDIPWETHLSPDGTLAVDFTGAGSATNHSRYGAQRVKDAVVDRFRDLYGRRPSVDRQRPDLRINVHIQRDTAGISLDLSGDALHRRGYRENTVIAPLKENLAAALLIKLDWPTLAASGGTLLDPMCGSGTLPIEAAWLATDTAPGLLRDYWGFQGWLQHEAEVWTALVQEAQQRREQGLSQTPPIRGYDRDARAIRAALANAQQAGVGPLIHWQRQDLDHIQPSPADKPGLVIVNPPYGERLSEQHTLEPLYIQLGDIFKKHFPQWRAAVFTANPDLGKRMGLKAQRINTFYNGALNCKLLSFSVEPRYFVDREAADTRTQQANFAAAVDAGADMFINRLDKNRRTLNPWVQREGISCYRLYDADIPEYAVAVDLYEQWVHVQEYQAPRHIDPARAQARLQQIMSVIPHVLDVPAERVFLKVRQRQKGRDQYQKQAHTAHFHEVNEGACRFLVNLEDYLDTGLFLDHRPTRKLLGQLARGKRFLNLFAYTGTATVHAALGGATSTTSVDLSRTYLDWAQRNLELNDIHGPWHRLVRADCLKWLQQDRGRYDLIFLDPPTFSNSKTMSEHFDVQRDHPDLIRQTLKRLAPQGLLLFSTNHRHFKLDTEALAGLAITEMTRQTIPRDFQRHSHIHRCWKIRQSSRS